MLTSDRVYAEVLEETGDADLASAAALLTEDAEDAIEGGYHLSPADYDDFA